MSSNEVGRWHESLPEQQFAIRLAGKSDLHDGHVLCHMTPFILATDPRESFDREQLHSLYRFEVKQSYLTITFLARFTILFLAILIYILHNVNKVPVLQWLTNTNDFKQPKYNTNR